MNGFILRFLSLTNEDMTKAKNCEHHIEWFVSRTLLWFLSDKNCKSILFHIQRYDIHLSDFSPLSRFSNQSKIFVSTKNAKLVMSSLKLRIMESFIYKTCHYRQFHWCFVLFHWCFVLFCFADVLRAVKIKFKHQVQNGKKSFLKRFFYILNTDSASLWKSVISAMLNAYLIILLISLITDQW